MLIWSFDPGLRPKPVKEKLTTAECPKIEADPNENATGPICSDYLCERDCIEGFKPSHPMKVS